MRAPGLLLLIAMALLGSAAGPADPKAAANAKPGTLTDLTPEFVAFADASAALPDVERIKAFHARFDPVLPGYYDGKGAKQAGFDGFATLFLKNWPKNREKFIATAAAFGSAFTRGQDHFKTAFPDYSLSVPVYLVHSMGQQDGGTRTIGGRTIMFFGADVIAAIHDETTIGPFLDHELFHIYHEKYFGNCPGLWCSLWEEGMATYVAAQLNPGASDRALLLNQPRPIRPEVEPRLAEAMCSLRAKLDSALPEDYASFFLGGGAKGPFPPRYGYFLGYLLAAKIGATMPLQTLAKLPRDKVRPLLMAAIDSYGLCEPPADLTP